MVVRCLACALAVLLLLGGCTARQQPAPAKPPGKPVAKITSRTVDGRVQALTVYSPALARPAKVTVLLPAGWAKGARRWPVLYLLHGCCGTTHDGWLTEGDADRITARVGAVVIIPEGGEMGWYTDWKSGPAWETFHMAELRPLLEAEYGVGGPRVIAGLSMGGHGALNYAARYPGAFEAAASFSGVLDIRQDPQGFGDFLRANGAEPTRIWGPVSAWAARNPADLIPALKGVRLYLSTGNGDPGPLDSGGPPDRTEAALYLQAQTFLARARQAGLDVKADLYGPGTHTWPYWSRALVRALPTLFPAGGRR